MSEEYLKDVTIVFVSDFYDIPLAGHAWYKGKYCFFEIVNPEKGGLYRLYSVSRLETILRIVERRLFEDTVGYLWTTFEDQPRTARGPQVVESYKAFYDDPDLRYLMAADRNKNGTSTSIKKTEIGLFLRD